jgi:hypothetical protein
MGFRILLSTVVLLLAMTGAALSEPRRVLLLHSFGPNFAPWNEYARAIREELRLQSKEPIDIFEASLATARSADKEEGPFVEYLRALFSKDQLDLVITIGAPAVNFRIDPSCFPLYLPCTPAWNNGAFPSVRLQRMTPSLRSRSILPMQSGACCGSCRKPPALPS